MVTPILIHPVYIEIQFLDKENNLYNPILEEHIGEINLLKPVTLLAQKRKPVQQEELGMVRGGDSPDSADYFLIYQSEWRQKANIPVDEPIDLDVFRTGVITKVECYKTYYKISNAAPVTVYGYKTHFIRLDYQAPETGN